MIEPDALLAHDRQHVLAGHDGAAQVDGVDAVEGVLRDLGRDGIAAGQADADVVVQDVDAAPQLHGLGDGGLQRRLLRDVGLEGHACAALLGDQRRRLLGRVEAWSTASTLAPSRANTSAVARPLPMPSPGPWPAPTTMAVFPSSRIVSSVLLPLPMLCRSGRGDLLSLSRSARRPPIRPCRASCTSTGLRSISAIASAWSAANCDSRTISVDQRVDVGGRRAAVGLEQGRALQAGEQLACLAGSPAARAPAPRP